MPAVLLEGAVPPPLSFSSQPSWTPYRPFTPQHRHQFSTPPPTSSPAAMSADSLPAYMPHMTESSMPPQDLNNMSMYGSPVPGPDMSNEFAVPFDYQAPYVTPQTSSINFSPQPALSKPVDLSSSMAQSPISVYSHFSDHADHFLAAHEDHFPDAPKTSIELPPHLKLETDPPTRPRSSPSSFNPDPNGVPWAMNPLGLSTPPMPEQMYAGSPYASIRTRSPRLSEPAMDMSHMATPQPRRMYAPIAPHPMVQQRTSHPSKRARDEDETSEPGKRRKRSDSHNSMHSMELGEEDRLLIRLKDEESMPWKDIAQRFQTDLGKTYQIPALQMRLKRLRERMRVWTEADVKALRMAHDYWVQSKFDIISQKMIEFGATEKWTARQCARKWAEIDPGPTPYTTYEHPAPSYAPYTMSPIEAPPYLAYMPLP